jgi:hypothetical protein
VKKRCLSYNYLHIFLKHVEEVRLPTIADVSTTNKIYIHLI